ncbi:hypothetical protein BDM02DRAFT_3187906 [Thelephora ganbajun]|uniref:Uncharacterized protein n=1 Tax=Thelephora ganbajun TaxID=370292 RepID=A0ACB6ZDZ8_THEGA|nr:hypothetical protein BDM02DRAFT_3187906 [Thelephora ganbajun]
MSALALRAFLAQTLVPVSVEPSSPASNISPSDVHAPGLASKVCFHGVGSPDLYKKTSSALKQNHKEIPLGHLGARKQPEGTLVKRSGTPESTFWTVEHATGDVEIMKLYESSTLTLYTILSHSSLQRDKIDEMMDALHSATEDGEEVDLTIRLAGEDEKYAANEWEALEELKRVEERLEGKTPMDVPGTPGELGRAGPVRRGIHAHV